MVLKFHLVIYLLLSFLINEKVIYRAENKITLKATEEAIVGNEYLFEGKSYLIVNDSLLREIIKTDSSFSHVVTTKVTDMSFLFYKSDFLNPQIESWDVSNVKNMSVMFCLAEVISPDLSHWDTRSVVDFSDMFHGTKKFQGDLSKWNTSSGELFNGMFFESNFNGTVNDWDISKAKKLSGMFDDAKFFNQPLDKWNTSNVEDMGGMFAEAISFNQDLSMWNVSKVKEMTNLFRNAVNFSQDLSNWDVPLIREMPEEFSTKSFVISPKWNLHKESGFNWYILWPFILLVPLLLILWKLRKKDSVSAYDKTYEALKNYLSENNTNQISKAGLDEILGTTKKGLDSQKKSRSNFIKQFNGSGLGEIYRVRDELDLRSYNYEIKWKNR